MNKLHPRKLTYKIKEQVMQQEANTQRRTMMTGGLVTLGVMCAAGWINYRRTAIASNTAFGVSRTKDPRPVATPLPPRKRSQTGNI